MRSLTFVSAVLAVLVSAAPASAQTPTPLRSIPRLSVTGHATIDRPPDRVVVALAVVTNDDVAARATSANTAAYEALAARLHALGIQTPAIRTTGFGITQNLRPAASPAPVMQPTFGVRYGYVVTRHVTVSSDRPEQAGAIVDVAVASGATSVDGVAFGLRDTDAAYRAALAAAVADGQAQANVLAAAAHQRIVGVTDISAASYQPVVPVPFDRIAVAGTLSSARSSASSFVQPSDLTLTVSVGMTFELVAL
jgi:uncharacterized protein